MNLYLHDIDPDDSPIKVADSLRSDTGGRFSMVLINPPSSKKSGVPVINGAGQAETPGAAPAPCGRR
jgi:type I restriction-modification system DNA methylase subunit